MLKTKIKTISSAAVLGAALPLMLVTSSVSAATVSWRGASGSDGAKLSVGANWDGGLPPAAGDVLEFSDQGTNTILENDLAGGVAGPVSVGGINFNGTYSGPSEKSYTIEGGAFTLNGDIVASMGGNAGNHSVKGTRLVLGKDITFKTTKKNTLTVGGPDQTSSYTVTELNGHTLTLDGDGSNVSLEGGIKGNGKIILKGNVSSRINLDEEAKVEFILHQTDTKQRLSNFKGSDFTVDSGGLLIGGASKNSNEDNVNSNKVLKLSLMAGVINPGYPAEMMMDNKTSNGCMYSTDFIARGGTLELDVAKPVKKNTCEEHDQIVASSSVDLGKNTELKLNLSEGFKPKVNDTITIIDNTGKSAVKGAFKGLKDGKIFQVGKYHFQINYNAGTGNDVVLLVKGTPSAPYTGLAQIVTSPVAVVASVFAAVAILGAWKFVEVRKR